MNNSPESDPIKYLHALTAKAGEALDDDETFDATINELNDKLRAAELEHLDKLIGITKQYESQLDVLKNAGLLSNLSDGSEGIIGEDGAQHPVPSLLSIVQRFCEDEKKYELLRRKVEQGFTKLIMVPFASSLNDLVDAYANQLVRHNLEGRLFGEGKSPAANAGKVAELLWLETSEPVYKWTAYDSEETAYFPTSFDSENDTGLTKQEAITQKGGWQVYLIEETPIPKIGKGANKNGRQQLETGLSPRQYLERLQADPQYKGEVGLTPESWLMRALTRLKERGEVIDDSEGTGAINYILGLYIAGGGQCVSRANWSRGRFQASLGGFHAENSDLSIGASTAVMV